MFPGNNILGPKMTVLIPQDVNDLQVSNIHISVSGPVLQGFRITCFATLDNIALSSPNINFILICIHTKFPTTYMAMITHAYYIFILQHKIDLGVSNSHINTCTHTHTHTCEHPPTQQCTPIQSPTLLHICISYTYYMFGTHMYFGCTMSKPLNVLN